MMHINEQEIWERTKSTKLFSEPSPMYAIEVYRKARRRGIGWRKRNQLSSFQFPVTIPTTGQCDVCYFAFVTQQSVTQTLANPEHAPRFLLPFYTLSMGYDLPKYRLHREPSNLSWIALIRQFRRYGACSFIDTSCCSREFH